MITDNTGSETSKFVDELIDLEEALERLEDAKVVVENLNEKISAGVLTIADLREVIARRDERIAWLAKVCQQIALDLARAGGYDHKGKNERILAAITNLLEIAMPRNLDWKPADSQHDSDDPPF